MASPHADAWSLLPMSLSHRVLATSNHPLIVAARGLRRRVQRFSIPAPRVVTLPILWTYLAIRSAYYFGLRVLVCEPLFKAYCKSYGRRLRTDVFLPWIQGRGEIIVGDDVLIDGKCGFAFAARFTDHPTLVIGDRTGLGHGCQITIGKRITIGSDCRIASHVWMFDSSGHPTDPEARRNGLPTADEDVRPIVVEDNVWIGGRSIVFPGVTIGAGSVVAAGSVVMSNIPPNTVVAGNPARRIASLKSSDARDDQPRSSAAAETPAQEIA
jgi:acetyltransferase-like isoleucine patch superfamily enzyme